MAGLSYAFDANAGETPQSVTQKRQLADALAARIFGRAPQNVGEGLNAIGQALIARTMAGEATDAQKAGMATIPSWAGGSAPSSAGIASAITGQPPVDPTQAAAPGNLPAPQPSLMSPQASVPVAPPQPDTTGKIYNNNEPSPLDPPSGADRQAMIQTILGEAGNQPALGQQAVASVIRNRAVDGGYGGDTPTGVVQSPNQFEPWNTAAGRTRMASAASNPAQAAQADAAISAAYGEGGKAPDDPTEGKTMFYAPAAQAALGRPAPSWAQGEGQRIGDHVFYDDNSETPPNAQMAQGTAPPGVPPVAPPGIPAPAPIAAPAAQKSYGGAFPNVSNDDLTKAAVNPWVPATTRQLLSAEIQRRSTVDQQNSDPLRQLQIQKAQRDIQPVGAPYHDEDGNLVQKGADGKVNMLSAADKSPTSVREYEYGKTHPDFAAAQTANGLSLNPIYGKDANGNTVLLQAGKNGTAVQSKLPEGVTLNGVDNETLAADAARLNAGDATIMKKYSNKGQGRVDLLRLNNEANRQRMEAGLDPIDVTQNAVAMQGDLARERAAGNMEGRMAPAAVEAQGAFKIAREASENLSRTNFVPYNKVLQAGQSAFSNPELKAAATAYNTAVMTYSKAITPTGVGTVTAQEHARQILETADGPQATKAAFDQLSREVDMAHQSPGLARQYFADERKAKMEGKPPPPMPQYQSPVGMAPAATVQSAATPPAQSAVKEGATIVNPQTGERRTLQGGKWVPLT